MRRPRQIDGLASELVKQGVDEATARIQARLHLAVARGLLLDLHATETPDSGQLGERSPGDGYRLARGLKVGGAGTFCRRSSRPPD
ncbi:MAG: hypothetical protein M3Z75_15955 [Actinomycetota bacterium]|nr:hypothetical protein [Actinomycetota bacterium]